MTREELSNAARHAHASRVTIEVTVEEAQVVLTVVDNGCGMAQSGRRSGLANLADRARAVGGKSTVDTPQAGGTRLVWRAPLGGLESLRG